MSLIFSVLISTLAVASATPINARAVTSLNQAAFEEAQQRDDAATRAFSSTAIKTSTGQCLFVNELSGDFRANLTPVQVAACDGSTGQQWDVITSGTHNDAAGTMLLVNTLTQACMNFDPRRVGGNTVVMFSCGGRADGGGGVANSQQFAFNGGAGPLSFTPQNAAGTCLAITSGNVLDQAPCAAGEASQAFTFGEEASGPAPASSSSVASLATSAATISPEPSSTSAAAAPVITSSASAPNEKQTTPVPVSRAGGVLQPSAAAESNPKDTTATLAFTSASLKTSSGQCLTIDPTAGDFRQNLIPVAISPCTGAIGQKFDLITKGKHNDAANSTLVVSSLTNGCLNFDPRRAAGDTAILFSCGGRAAGEGLVTDSQLFGFGGGNEIVLAPESEKGNTCLVANGAKLDSAACTGSAEQTFSIVA
ncbi:hypothetical protein BJ875DRAFT_44420 [Amylocarpus encephaloides]|uniref:Ricin B lectin domain-containing protein n=1 Tax=Amylocarpus encephaloides TaxID=45428 RepID=A0A9P8C4R5_9HELO|nr:hypothetical protein BJ875DRAFT_44420 [Amylocarpus encephaloides]